MTNRRPLDQESIENADIGPVIPSALKRQKTKILEHETLFLNQLPNSEQYEISYMHRDIVNHVVATRTDYIITTSIDGHVKFWKKNEAGIEFVKHFRACLGAIVAVDASFDGVLFACASVDKGLKVFDIVNFDMINMFKLQYLPNALCWMYQQGAALALLACSDKDSCNVNIFDGRGGTGVLRTIDALHTNPVHLMKFNPIANVVISSDESGSLEYWTPDPSLPAGAVDGNGEDQLLKSKGFVEASSYVTSWKFKSETDLYEFKKNRCCPTSISFSPDYSKFVIFSFRDRQVRVFNFKSAKLLKKYDESLECATRMQASEVLVSKIDDMEFGRRLAIERDIEKNGIDKGQAVTCNAVFDESGNFIIYATLLGIKIVNIHTNRVTCLVGKQETLRFMNITLYQGAPKKKGLVTVDMAASENTVIKESEQTDPTLYCTAYKKSRFYCFSRREPDSSTGASGGRDIYNEKPTKDDQANSSSKMGEDISTAIIHTTFGDIYVKLFPLLAPKACKNFIEHSKSGYFDNCLFHRVIKSFMIQTGDPLGDGTGGDSIYGHDFEDEFHPDLRHSQPYMLSMANSGPNTNSSQFFVTTVATPWLDDKHTIFGKCTGGLDVIHKIEISNVDKHDRPIEKIRILSIEIREI